MNFFRPVINSRKSGTHWPSVVLGRQLMLPTWGVNFENGYQYLLIYYDKGWSAIDAPRYSRPNRTIVRALAKAIRQRASAPPSEESRLIDVIWRPPKARAVGSVPRASQQEIFLPNLPAATFQV